MKRNSRRALNWDILAADERYAYSVLQDQLAQQMARQIMSCADWHEVNSGDGKNIYIEVDVVVKPFQDVADGLASWARADVQCRMLIHGQLGISDMGFELSCGHDVPMLFNEPPKFCPECGAKVVEE